MVETVESAGDADTVLIRKLLVKVVKVKKQDLAAIDDLVFLQLLDEDSTELFLRGEKKVDVVQSVSCNCVLWLYWYCPIVVNFPCISPFVPATFPESAPPNNVN